MQARKLVAEALGTAILVFLAVGVATLTFGMKDYSASGLVGQPAQGAVIPLFGTTASAGIVATALSFGFVLLGLAYAIGPISGAHVNPAVTLGFLLSGRQKPQEAVGYWVAQFIGGIAGGAALYGIVSSTSMWHGSGANASSLGADGFGAKSMVGLGWGGAFIAEAILTFVFVLIVLLATSKIADATAGGLAVGIGLLIVHLVGIPLTGTSVNPARALAAAIFSGSTALGQVWLFIVAPLVGGAVAAGAYKFFVPSESEPPPVRGPEESPVEPAL
ncbi:MAG: aquaporin [Solirubrobacterales bacterium]|nr:aquaporin [Solirubrobacterales bacterium]